MGIFCQNQLGQDTQGMEAENAMFLDPGWSQATYSHQST